MWQRIFVNGEGIKQYGTYSYSKRTEFYSDGYLVEIEIERLGNSDVYFDVEVFNKKYVIVEFESRLLILPIKLNNIFRVWIKNHLLKFRIDNLN